jgi:hypothetical protein
VSSSFRPVAVADYSDVLLKEGDTPLRGVLDAIRASFKEDEMVGLSMLGVGVALLPLMGELCAALGLRDRVESEAWQLRAAAGQTAVGVIGRSRRT